ncbi:hypothetical protein STCU_09965 [Strigomonas culicis]|uniref:Uncharacterized protein n=1 Tax=Strigomonas culicis TaxID=28005 RepID=S9UVA9_9TRYP|nr:hypothetical protein STCU_09965 [Strigomonas culicis]|eukprot:EPY18451.1 hypothetical protein STCU_09965 [Strigomonas culicis]
MRKANAPQISDEPSEEAEEEEANSNEEKESVNTSANDSTSSDDTNAVRADGRKTKFGKFVKNVKNIKRRVSNTMASFLMSKRTKSASDIRLEKEVDSHNNSTDNGATEYGSRSKSCNTSLYDDYAHQSHPNPFEGGEQKYADAVPAAPDSSAARRAKESAAPAAPREHRAPSQPRTDSEMRHTMPSEKTDLPKRSKKHKDFDDVVDTVVGGAKELKRRVSMTMNVPFSSENQMESPYGSMYGGMSSEGEHAARDGSDRKKQKNAPLDGQLPDNTSRTPIEEDTSYDIILIDESDQDHPAAETTKAVEVTENANNDAHALSPILSAAVSPASLEMTVQPYKGPTTEAVRVAVT